MFKNKIDKERKLITFVSDKFEGYKIVSHTIFIDLQS